MKNKQTVVKLGQQQWLKGGVAVNGTQKKQVGEFKYLGSIFSQDCHIDRQIETRIQKANAVAWQLAPLLSHKNIPLNLKSQLINSIFLPTLTYQYQTWALNAALERKITACEMKYLRKTINVTRRDRIRNKTIWEQRRTLPITKFIEQHRIKQFGDMIRMTSNQPATRTLR